MPEAPRRSLLDKGWSTLRQVGQLGPLVRPQLVALVVASVLALPSYLWAQQEQAEGDGEDPPQVEIVQARLAAPSGHRSVLEVRRLLPAAGRVDVSRQGDRLAYDRRSPEGYWQLFVSDAEGQGESCVTCKNYDLRRANVYGPVWHPSGDFLVAQVQLLARRLKHGVLEQASPRRALHSELWVFTPDGRDSWQLTEVGRNGGALLDPHFSYEGGQLVWSERLDNRAGPWGTWGLRVAEMEIARRLPRLGKVRTYEPGGEGRFLVAHSFTPDDRGFLLAGDLQEQARATDRDLWVVRLGEGKEMEKTPLTRSAGVRDGVAAIGPKDELVVWASDRSIAAPRGQRLPWRSDLWLGQLDGPRQERLTFFNDGSAPGNLGEAQVADIAWSPAGDRIYLQVLSPSPRDPEAVDEAIYLLLLDESFRR